ncbi:TetR family transcriptional regulator [Lentzea sp. NPDC004782]|uniref:TetR family transcriptional regulator n=1 Tax=Lentzea sp. NPDC004782 TaxID=3154458 RepID=UPI0033B0E0B5
MPRRDREQTRRRLLDAAFVEFAAYGIAGARMERIARIAGCSTGLVYTYYGGKQELFDAVQAEVVDAAFVAFDAADLPGYAARCYDRQHDHPELARLAAWRRLERPGQVTRSAEIEAIRQAQARGLVSTRFSAEQVLVLVLAIASMWSNAPADGSDHAARRRAVEDAVWRLVEP